MLHALDVVTSSLQSTDGYFIRVRSLYNVWQFPLITQTVRQKIVMIRDSVHEITAEVTQQLRNVS